MCQKYCIHYKTTGVIFLGLIWKTLVILMKYKIYIIAFFSCHNAK